MIISQYWEIFSFRLFYKVISAIHEVDFLAKGKHIGYGKANFADLQKRMGTKRFIANVQQIVSDYAFQNVAVVVVKIERFGVPIAEIDDVFSGFVRNEFDFLFYPF